MKIVISNNIILNLNQEEIDVDEFIQISEKLKGFQKDYPYESEEEKNKVKQVLKNEEKLKPKQILWERKQIKWTKQKAIELAKIKFDKNLSYNEKYLKFKEMFPDISQEYFTSNYLEKGFYKILQKYKINKHNLKLYNYSLKETKTKTKKIKRAKARHNWNEQGRDSVVEMIKVHYTGTKEDRDRLAKKHNDSYLNLSKSFSNLIKRFNIKPGEIGLKEFKKENEKESKNKEEIKNFINKMSEKVYDMRIKDNKEFSEIRKELNITNTEARQYYKRHYDFINKQQILENNEFNGNGNNNPIKIRTAEEELIKFFNEIELHTPEQIQKAIMLLYDYLKNLKGREIMANDIIEFLNEKVNEEKAIEIINNNRNNIIQWIGE